MDFKTMAISATLGGTILLSGLTFTGHIDLQDIKGFGADWANKLTTAVQNSKDMASKFSIFKSDAEKLINEKIAEINSLNARISELGEQVASGAVNLEDANNEIARLNEQLEQANNEVKALKDEFALKDSEVQTAFSEMVTADSLDTTLSLDSQTSAPEAPEEEPTPEEEPEPEVQSNEDIMKSAIHNKLTTKYPLLDELQVTVTANKITISEPNLFTAENNYGNTYRADIMSVTGLSSTKLGDAVKDIATNSYSFTINN
jgi:predicted nuclease with TOPRIM domain